MAEYVTDWQEHYRLKRERVGRADGGRLMGASYRPRSEDELDAFTCPKCGGQVVMEHDLPRRVTGLGSIDFRCLGCGDWIDVALDGGHICKPVREFEEYAVGVAREYFESRAREVRQ